MLNNFGVYRILNTVNNKSYIGSSANKKGLQQRFKDHAKRLRNGTHHNIYLQRAYNKYGAQNFIYQVLVVCSRSSCVRLEQFMLDTLKPEYNICKIAGNTVGLNCENYMTEKAILQKRQKQSKNISIALRGVTKTPEHAIKCGAKAFKVYEAIRISSRPSVYSKGKCLGLWLKTQDCALFFGIKKESIIRCLAGKRKQYLGYIFEREDHV